MGTISGANHNGVPCGKKLANHIVQTGDFVSTSVGFVSLFIAFCLYSCLYD